MTQESKNSDSKDTATNKDYDSPYCQWCGEDKRGKCCCEV